MKMNFGTKLVAAAAITASAMAVTTFDAPAASAQTNCGELYEAAEYYWLRARILDIGWMWERAAAERVVAETLYDTAVNRDCSY